MRILLPLLIGLLSLPAQAIDLSGIAEFDQRLTLNSSISGRVEQVHVEIGQSAGVDIATEVDSQCLLDRLGRPVAYQREGVPLAVEPDPETACERIEIEDGLGPQMRRLT